VDLETLLGLRRSVTFRNCLRYQDELLVSSNHDNSWETALWLGGTSPCASR
jgi:hypothetical protein